MLANAVGVSNTAGPHEIALTEAMVARQLLSFFVFSSAGASPDGIGYLLSDDILALTAEATAPTDAENALPVVTASYSASNFSSSLATTLSTERTILRFGFGLRAWQPTR